MHEHPGWHGLASREACAREALRRLRDCSREIERSAAAPDAIADHTAAESARRDLRALKVQVRKIGAAIGEWNTSDAPTWDARVRAPLELLARGVAGFEVGSTSQGEASQSRARLWPFRRPVHVSVRAEEIEERVYSYLYGRQSVDAALG